MSLPASPRWATCRKSSNVRTAAARRFGSTATEAVSSPAPNPVKTAWHWGIEQGRRQVSKFFTQIEPALREFIERQHIFFTASATADSRINLSPKGSDSLRVIGPNQVAY